MEWRIAETLAVLKYEILIALMIVSILLFTSNQISVHVPGMTQYFSTTTFLHQLLDFKIDTNYNYIASTDRSLYVC